MGAQDKFSWRGFDAVAGDQQLFLTTGQSGLGEPLRGFSLTKKDKLQSLVVFAGLTGQVFSVPYFSGTQAKTPAAGFQFTRVLPKGFAFSTVAAVDGKGKKTSLQELDYIWRQVKVTGAGGVLENKKFFNGLAQGSWRHFGVSLGHGDYFYQGQRSTVNSESVALSFGPVFGNASAFQSTFATGQAASVGVRFSAVQIQGQELWSKYGRTSMATITEQLTRHFRVSQYLTHSGNQNSLNFGFSYQSNRASVDVSYQQEYMPFSVHPFAKALIVQLSLHIHGATVSGGTLTDPNGKTRFTAYGNEFIQTGIQVQGDTGRQVGGTRYFGRVLDAQGTPVAGAAVVVGTQTVYTDETGAFQATTKKPETLPLRVALDEFVCQGNWEVVDAPTSAVPGTGVIITVRRK